MATLQFPPPANDALARSRILLEAAAEFSAWVQTHAPGAIVMLCGGLAFVQYGNQRTTMDVDLCMDLRYAVRAGTTRRVNTNALKDVASQDPRLVVGPKIYWRHSATGTLVQVDFVDANLFWSPFDVRQMLDTSVVMPSLNLPTLLVGKIKSAIERNQSNAMERSVKQSTDILDFDFAVTRCFTRRIPLTAHHIAHLGATPNLALATVREFSLLRRVLGSMGMDPKATTWIASWEALVAFSRLPADLVSVANNPASA